MNNFNPIKEDRDGVVAHRTIWTTKSLDLAIKGLHEGRRLIANPFYENNIKLLKGDLVFERTSEEIEEWKRCAKDVVYFAEKYCKLLTPEGIQHIKLRDYQKRYLRFLSENRMTVYLAARQSGKSVTTSIYVLWYILFNFDKNSLIIADIRRHAVEVLDKAKKIFYEVPYFLKPGIYKWNESEIVLDNGCRMMASATTITAAISYTFHEIIWDEAAHLSASVQEKFYNNLYPTLSAANASLRISSTQNGYNLFYRLYKAAEAEDSDYRAFKTDWDEVPDWNPEKRCWEKRDEAWHRRQVANLGSEEAFNSQFGTEFDVNVNTLVHRKKLQSCQQTTEQFVNQDLPGVSLSYNYYWKPGYEPQSDLRKDYIVITGDLAKGVEQDSTAFPICRMIEPGSDKLECVGYYRSKDVDRKDIAKSLMEMVAIHCNPDHTLFSFELNTWGELFLKHINDFEEKGVVPGFDKSVLVKYFNDSGTKFEYGVQITRGNKSTHCILFKEDFEKGKINNTATDFVSELINFADVEGKGVWKAAFGHDDLVMAMIQIEFVKKTLQYILMKQEFDSIIETHEEEHSDDQVNAYSEYFQKSPEEIYEEEQRSMLNRLSRFS